MKEHENQEDVKLDLTIHLAIGIIWEIIESGLPLKDDHHEEQHQKDRDGIRCCAGGCKGNTREKDSPPEIGEKSQKTSTFPLFFEFQQPDNARQPTHDGRKEQNVDEQEHQDQRKIRILHQLSSLISFDIFHLGHRIFDPFKRFK